MNKQWDLVVTNEPARRVNGSIYWEKRYHVVELPPNGEVALISIACSMPEDKSKVAQFLKQVIEDHNELISLKGREYNGR